MNSPYLGSVIFGISGGAVFELAEFSDELNIGYSILFSTYWPLPPLSENFLILFDIGWDNYSLVHSGNSQFFSLYAETGAAWRFPLHVFFQPYGGILFQGAWLHVNTDRMDKTDDLFRPGIVLEAGFFSEIYRGVGLRVALRHKFLPLSKKLYSPLSIEAGVTCRYTSFNTEDINREKKSFTVAEMLMKAENELNAGRLKESEKILHGILEKSPYHSDASVLAKKISDIKRDYASGERFYKNRRYLESIPYLNRTAFYFPASAEKITRIRKIYANRIPVWERRGMRAYEQQDYDTCIRLMRQIILIDPGNSTAGIYLPRALKRKKALQRLR